MGYALFKRNESEEIGSSSKVAQKSIQDFKSFSELVKLKSFVPFEDPEHSLDNINKLSEGKTISFEYHCNTMNRFNA